MQRIIVVDDVEINRELLKNILEDDYKVELAEDGQQALQKLEEYQRETAVVLLDLHMPGMDGYAVIAEMKNRGWMRKSAGA